MLNCVCLVVYRKDAVWDVLSEMPVAASSAAVCSAILGLSTLAAAGSPCSEILSTISSIWHMPFLGLLALAAIYQSCLGLSGLALQGVSWPICKPAKRRLSKACTAAVYTGSG